MDLSEHAQINRAAWNVAAAEYADHARRSGAPRHHLGDLGPPETGIGALGDVAGKGRDRARLRHGVLLVLARPPRRAPGRHRLSERQLETAGAMQAEHGLEFPLLHGTAERVPLEDASFDSASPSTGRSLWCDPDAWVAEAARLLRPDGRLVFLTNSLLVTLCAPDAGAAGDRLLRHSAACAWSPTRTKPASSSISPTASGSPRCAPRLRRRGPARALRPGARAADRFEWVTPEWAQRWPFEEIWVARLRA
jgi:SAM-dependent methyltransferase